MIRSSQRFCSTLAIAVVLGVLLILNMAQTATAKDPRLGYIPLDEETYRNYIKVVPMGRLEAVLPSSYDARDDGIVTPAKDQGSCGSCWAFASVGALESHVLEKYGAGPYNLSEQQLVDCDDTSYGCDGGYLFALRYYESHGPVTESCYPYTATEGDCKEDSCAQMSYRVTGWHTVPQSEWYFKDSCYNEGPGSWAFFVYTDFYTFWNSDNPGAVYVNTVGSYYLGGHAVLLIGWDDAKGAYLCKNSWGATGGPNGDGTFWIAYSGHAHNLWFQMSNFDVTGGESAECPPCPAKGEIKNVAYPAGKECTCSNGVSLKIGPGVTIPKGATVTFIAPKITVDPDFQAEDGAVINMRQE